MNLHMVCNCVTLYTHSQMSTSDTGGYLNVSSGLWLCQYPGNDNV